MKNAAIFAFFTLGPSHTSFSQKITHLQAVAFRQEKKHKQAQL